MSIINSDGLNTNWQLNVLRGLQAIADEVAKPLTCAEDGVTVCSPPNGLNVNVHDALGNDITSTAVGADTGLDVNIINALPLEINLDAANDQVGIYGYDGTTPTPVSVDVNGFVNTNATVAFPSSLPVTQDPTSNPWTVDAIDLDIRDLDFATDSVDVSGSNVNAVVTAADLDIRDLTFATDSVDVTGSDITVSNTVDVSATDLDIRNLAFGTDSVDVSGSNINATITGPFGVQADCADAISTTLCKTQEDILTAIQTAVEGTVDVNIASGVTLEVNLDQSTDQVQVYGSDLIAPIATDTAGHLQVDILTIPEVEIKNDAGNPIPVTLPTGSVVPSLTRVNAGSATVAAGSYSVAFFNAGDQIAVVAGDNLNPGERVSFSAPEGKTLGLINYDVGLPILGEIRDLVISKVV